MTLHVQPSGNSRITREGSLRHKLAFLHHSAIGQDSPDLVTLVKPTYGAFAYQKTNTTKGVGTLYQAGATGLGSYFPRSASPDFGSGDFTVAVIGAFPTGSTAIAVAFDYVGTTAQWRLQPNHDGSASAANAFNFFTYNGAATNAGATNVITGVGQAFVGRRAGSIHTLWVDGINKTPSASSATVRSMADSTGLIDVGTFSHATSYGAAGSILLCAAWGRALSDSEIAEFSANPWALFDDDNAIDVAVLAGAASGTGGGTTTDALTVGNLSSGTPTLGNPAIGQIHGLTVGNLTSGTTTLGSPAIGQIHALTVGNLTFGTPTLGTPIVSDVSTVDNLTVGNLTFGTPTVGSPAIGQIHALTVGNLSLSNPTLGTPIVTDVPANVHALTVGNLTIAPTLGTPALGQVHALTVGNLIGTSPVLNSPAFGQIHLLAAPNGITIANPILGTPIVADVTAGTGTLDPATIDAIAEAVLAKLMANYIPVDVQKINATEVFGTGTNGDPWR